MRASDVELAPLNVAVVPLVDEGLGNSAYVVDLGDGGALVIDPERDPRPYLEVLERRALTPRFVVETHLHADFVSGGRELVARGASLLAPAGGELAFHHRSLADGDEVDLGGPVLEVIATPGHTPEHLAYLLRIGVQPVVLFSGGTLITGGVARTDLLSPERTEALARAAYRSIHERLLVLPDDLPVYPTHGGGSFCSTSTRGERTTTIGRERAANPLLADGADEDTFVARLLAGYGSFPPYFLELRAVNRHGSAVHGPTPPRLRQLSVDQVESAEVDGAQLVDVRSVRAFATGHVPGSLSNPWRDQFATWLGWLVPRDRPVVFVADGSVPREDLVWAALTVGYDQLAGELAGGIDAWKGSGRELATTELVDGSGGVGSSGVVDGVVAGRRVVDVRQSSEWESGHVPGATHLELGSLVGGVEGVPDQPVLVHCGHGERAMSGASLLERAGRRNIAVLLGPPRSLGELERGAQG